MTKYRIIKKTNFVISHTVLDEVYYVQVKKSIWGYKDLKWWTGTDVADDYFYDVELFRSKKDFPRPYGETDKKFHDKIIRTTDQYLLFTSFDAAKFFLERVKAQEEYILIELGKLKGMKEKTSVAYVDEEKPAETPIKKFDIIEL